MGLVSEIISAFEGKFRFIKKRRPIKDFDTFFDFLTTRASFVAQKTLYGYLKTRMGTKYPEMFSDDVFVESINLAKWNIYAACLSDLSVFMTAQAAVGFSGEWSDTEKADIARELYGKALKEKFENGEFDKPVEPFVKDFETRLLGVNWNNAHESENAFVVSPSSLVKWSPIADELKKYDAEIVRNSIRFQWNLIRQEYCDLIEYDSLFSDWNEISA